MDTQTFTRFREIIYKESGIVISPDKLPLLSNRINKRLTQLGVQSEREYLEIIETQLDGEELINLIDVVSTNVTHFYREPGHFTFLREYLTKLSAKSSQTVKLWCAAASSGEEPYTLACEAEAILGPKKVDFRILATDICTRVLNKALRRTYKESDIQSIPREILSKHFESCTLDGEHCYVVSEELSRHILFKRMNLVSYPYPVNGPIDVIFCRNVMIYFDSPTREKIVAQFSRILRPGGILVLSHSENLLGVSHSLEKITGSIYQKL